MSFFFFFSFSCLIALPCSYVTMWNKSGEGRHSCLVSDFGRKAFKLSPLNVVGLSSMAFIMLRYVAPWASQVALVVKSPACQCRSC